MTEVQLSGEWTFQDALPVIGSITEGNAWDGSRLLFTNIAMNRLLAYDPDTGTVVTERSGTNAANGLHFDREGRLFACPGAGRRRHRAGDGPSARSGGAGWGWRGNLAAVRASLDEIMGYPELEGASGGKALFVAGELSRYIRAEHMETIKRLFPNVRTATIPDAGHWVHADRPGPFIETVRDFLDRE